MTNLSLEDLITVLESLRELVADPTIDFGPSYEFVKHRQSKSISVVKNLIKSYNAWNDITVSIPFDTIDIQFSDGTILCECIPQLDGDIWWDGCGSGEKFFDPKYCDIIRWKLSDVKV